MSWFDDEDHPFAGIVEKLKRTDENIGNLNTEISTFFETSKHPVIPQVNDEGWQDAVDYHRARKIPKRFSVLSGEIVHHLRSCLDHLIWHFSSPQARREHENLLEFPVFRKPLTKREQLRYDGKVQGISKTAVLALIDQLQPYQRGSDAIDDPICIVHDMDRFDKHRELMIVTSCANVTFPAGTDFSAILKVIAHNQGQTLSAEDFAIAQNTVKHNAKVFPQVAFSKFGTRKTEFVVPALAQLQQAIIIAVDSFSKEL